MHMFRRPVCLAIGLAALILHLLAPPTQSLSWSGVPRSQAVYTSALALPALRFRSDDLSADAIPLDARSGAVTGIRNTGRCLRIVVRAAEYDRYREILGPDDLLWIRAARMGKPGTGELLFSEDRYQQVRSRLVELQSAPVRKCIIFSSYQDVEAKIDDIGPYVDLVAYNTEPHMTPDEELAQVEDSVRRFGQLVRSRGLAAGWGPTIRRLIEQPALLELASEVDFIGLQHQNVLARLGPEETVSQTRERALQIREFNSDIEINLQLSGDLKEIAEVLRQTTDHVDSVFVLSPHGAPTDYQQLFSDVDLRSGCVRPAQQATATAPPGATVMSVPSPTPTPEPSPTSSGPGAAELLPSLPPTPLPVVPTVRVPVSSPTAEPTVPVSRPSPMAESITSPIPSPTGEPAATPTACPSAPGMGDRLINPWLGGVILGVGLALVFVLRHYVAGRAGRT